MTVLDYDVEMEYKETLNRTQKKTDETDGINLNWKIDKNKTIKKVKEKKKLEGWDEVRIRKKDGTDDDDDEESNIKETSIARAARLTKEDERRKEKQEQKENEIEENARGGQSEWIDHKEED